MPYKDIEKRREYQKEYHKKYSKLPKSKESWKCASEKYRNTPKGKEAIKKYCSSIKGQEAHRRRELKKYRMTLVEYNKLFNQQNGKCYHYEKVSLWIMTIHVV